MNLFGILFGLILAAVAFYFWYKWYKAVKGDAAEWTSKQEAGGGESLEAFIAAYRSGAATAKDAPSPAPKPLSPAAVPVAQAAAAPIPVPATAPVAKESFLAGAPKLGYLLCKAALRDHHIFAHVPLRSLASPGLDARVAETTVDLLVCNAQLAPVAAIDVAGAEAGPPDAAKVQALRGLGLRYLRLSAKSLPRPEQLKDLLYRM
jgi:hypothetical protein